jgi:hypothetical protein
VSDLSDLVGQRFGVDFEGTGVTLRIEPIVALGCAR